jgi:hypothetical protein
MMNPIALVTVKTRLRKSSSGRIGSAARVSTKTNAASRAAPMTSSAIICGAPHA